jgi:heme-binding NEAT domain protein
VSIAHHKLEIKERRAPNGNKTLIMTINNEGIKPYYKQKIQELEVICNDKTRNLRRLEAQRNDLNAKGASFSKTIHTLD